MHVHKMFRVALGRDGVSEFTVDDDGMTLLMNEDGAMSLHTSLSGMLTPEVEVPDSEERANAHIQKHTLRGWSLSRTSDPDLCNAAARTFDPGPRQIVPSVYVLGSNETPLGAHLCAELLRAGLWLQPRVRDYHYNGELVCWSLRPVLVSNVTRYVAVACTTVHGIVLAGALDVAAIHAGAGVFIPKFQ